MSNATLDARLAEKVMGWRVGPERFLLSNRQWKKRTYFQPTLRAADAFRLLQGAGPDRYSCTRSRSGVYSVTVRIGKRVGKASEPSEALAITLAVARAFGLYQEATK